MNVNGNTEADAVGLGSVLMSGTNVACPDHISSGVTCTSQVGATAISEISANQEVYPFQDTD